MLILVLSTTACDTGGSSIVTATFEAENGSNYIYEDIKINGQNYGDSLPITTSLEKGTYHISFINTIIGLEYSDTVNINRDGQTFVFSHTEIYEE